VGWILALTQSERASELLFCILAKPDEIFFDPNEKTIEIWDI